MNTVKPITYVACLCTDNYLSGVLVLYESLRKTNPKYPFLCLVSSNVSDATIDELKKRNINVALTFLSGKLNLLSK